MLTEEWSSPVLVKEKPQQPPPEGDAKKRKVNNLLVAAILVGIVVLGLLIFFYVIRHRGGRQTAGVPATSAARPTDVYYGEPARAAEQSFVISSAQREGGSQGPEIILDTAAAETEPPPETVPAGAPARQPVVTSQSPIVTRTQRETPASNSRTDLPTSSREDSVSTESRQSDSPSPFVAVEKDPQIIRLEKPRFPDFAYARQLEGQVTLQVQIDADGRPIQTKIISSTNSLIEPAIVDAVMKSEFSPARMSTGPVTSWLTIPYRFKLQR
jgi:protein TonB